MIIIMVRAGSLVRCIAALITTVVLLGITSGEHQETPVPSTQPQTSTNVASR